MSEHYTQEGVGFVDATREDAVEEARKRHHLATADPDKEETMTGPAHEEKYGLERAESSAAAWRAVGVHPIENRALVGDEDGAENLRGIAGSGDIETATQSGDAETTAAHRASDDTK